MWYARPTPRLPRDASGRPRIIRTAREVFGVQQAAAGTLQVIRVKKAGRGDQYRVQLGGPSTLPGAITVNGRLLRDLDRLAELILQDDPREHATLGLPVPRGEWLAWLQQQTGDSFKG